MLKLSLSIIVTKILTDSTYLDKKSVPGYIGFFSLVVQNFGHALWYLLSFIIWREKIEVNVLQYLKNLPGGQTTVLG